MSLSQSRASTPHEVLFERFKNASVDAMLIATSAFVSAAAFIVCTRALIRWAGQMTSSPRILAITGLLIYGCVAHAS